jgi:hypothetical protein
MLGSARLSLSGPLYTDQRLWHNPSMSDLPWFDDIPVLSHMSVDDAVDRLRAIGEIEVADAIAAQMKRTSQPVDQFFGLPAFGLTGARPWQHGGHVFGFIPKTLGYGERTILPAGEIRPDVSLRKQRVTVTLDRLAVAEYPGRGTHQIVLDFSGRHISRGGASEGLHFAVTQRVRDGEQAAVTGLPIFVGLNVGEHGIAFRGYTVCVGSQDDESLISFLESDVFRAGLRLTSAVQPAVGLVASMACGITKALAQHRANVPVQEFHMGLDFSGLVTRAALAEGSYLAVQIPEVQARAWDWDDWSFDPGRGALVRADNQNNPAPYNYIVFGVSRYEHGSKQ